MEPVVRNVSNKSPVFEANKVGMGVEIGVVILTTSRCSCFSLRVAVVREMDLPKLPHPDDSFLIVSGHPPAAQTAGQVLDQLPAFAKVIFEYRAEILDSLQPCINLLGLFGA